MAKVSTASAGPVISPYHEPPDKETLRHGAIVQRLQQALEFEETFRYFPMWLVEVIEEKHWRHFCNPTTYAVYDYRDFDEFVRIERPRGLGVVGGIAFLYGECRFYAEQGDENAAKALELLRDMMPAAPPHDETKGGRGKKTVDNINGLSKGGTSETYLLRRLKRDRQDLAARVIAGELSAHKAAIEAGIRKRLVYVAPTVEGFARAIVKHLQPKERDELKRVLG
jgi:hypothetical protein